MEDNSSAMEINDKLIRSFVQITSSSREEAKLLLERLKWDLDAAVSTFLDNDAATAVAAPNVLNGSNQKLSWPARNRSSNHRDSIPASSPSLSHSSDYSPSESSSSPSRSRSSGPSLPQARYPLRSKRAANEPLGSQTSKRRQLSGNVRPFVDLNRSSSAGADSDSDEAQVYYTGGDKSGMLVENLRKLRVVHTNFDEVKESAVETPAPQARLTSENLTGTIPLSGETASAAPQDQQPDQPQVVTDAPLMRLNDPENASLLETQETPKLKSPKSLLHSFGRSLGASSSEVTSTASAVPVNSSLLPIMVDPAIPTTLIKLRLADGTCLISRFNIHHTIRDVRVFIDASRPSGSKDYQLLTMGLPLQLLPDLDQTIEKAGIANSVVIQKF